MAKMLYNIHIHATVAPFPRNDIASRMFRGPRSKANLESKFRFFKFNKNLRSNKKAVAEALEETRTTAAIPGFEVREATIQSREEIRGRYGVDLCSSLHIPNLGFISANNMSVQAKVLTEFRRDELKRRARVKPYSRAEGSVLMPKCYVGSNTSTPNSNTSSQEALNTTPHRDRNETPKQTEASTTEYGGRNTTSKVICTPCSKAWTSGAKGQQGPRNRKIRYLNRAGEGLPAARTHEQKPAMSPERSGNPVLRVLELGAIGQRKYVLQDNSGDS
ncbi:hypothetical protein PCH_Pc20g02070 [Penicillium rubens Wisconsin 54-1255]|uniref:Uncharacterized protein n=1 Tax=Penicillium rubens (strain ATCC 28089 / DSM 1075 / NRRL 1951 / Wisconsin 54-1255) TaxID=500485 RepID=B6HE81_PENRW|nr:hypothetical protein PCH_Pc20g02070 [Penicillium rubens Wisconsin 54-1255]